MHVGLVIAGDLGQTSGGYRYDRRLRTYLEGQGETVDVISLPRREHGRHRQRADLDDSIRTRLNQPFDVLLQDELCYPTLLEVNPHLEAPKRIVSLVHLLESADPHVTDPQVRARERRYLESVDAAICTSEFTRTQTTALTALPTAVVPPAGRHETAAVSPAAVEARADESPLQLVFVGNLVPRKNIETLLEALERVGEQAEWELTIVGDTGEAPDYVADQRERVASAGLTDRVTFAGHVSDDRLESILERAHIIAVPSCYEGFGMVYLEAMEYGVVPIASTVGGANEIVTDGQSGFLVDPANAERMAEVVETLERNRTALVALGTRALTTADSHPSWDESMGTFRTVLQEWLATDDTRLESVPSKNTRGER
ncbi:glycosyltransferase family 4 protein [Natronolimnobius baerhuensis]|uniref:Group 1 glycosyl transferase n=1 Tax=Natronolimnobius baerhuensis TaxID=253108 RepID=A0A202EDA3_9EURY|nr:glycosyltransferase family 4 protein [Natronolimnobius baerhuensis]OVE86253.1 group 1 glycosyl transferase [Natronolimnobius baerhuensis]